MQTGLWQSRRLGAVGESCSRMLLTNEDRRIEVERTPESDGDETREDSDVEADSSSAGSAAEQAQKREREMEESGEENAG
jgi:hypothetical protein